MNAHGDDGDAVMEDWEVPNLWKIQGISEQSQAPLNITDFA